jgi:hypothetical protein
VFEAAISFSNPAGFIWLNKKNKLLKKTWCYCLVSLEVSQQMVILAFFFRGRWCICWWIFVPTGTREAHWRLCESWLLCGKCHYPKVRLHISWKARFQLEAPFSHPKVLLYTVWVRFSVRPYIICYWTIYFGRIFIFMSSMLYMLWDSSPQRWWIYPWHNPPSIYFLPAFAMKNKPGLVQTSLLFFEARLGHLCYNAIYITSLITWHHILQFNFN